MKQVLKNVIDAVENIPGPNAGPETVLAYQCRILTPVMQSLKNVSEDFLSPQEIHEVIQLIINFLEAIERHRDVCQAIARAMGATEIIECGTEQVELLESCLVKLSKLQMAEEISQAEVGRA